MPEGKEWPEVDEFVIASVKRIVPYGAYVTLDEYKDKEGLVHISEVSSGWIKNIRDYIREGQKVVLKVIRVDSSKRLVDLSLRRVSSLERRGKMLQWKLARKAQSILSLAGSELKLSERELKAVKSSIEENYESLYEGLRAACRDPEALSKIGIDERIARALTGIARERIKIVKAKVKGILNLTCPKSTGADIIRDILVKAKSMKKGVEVSIRVIGAPRYGIEVMAESPKEGESILREISDWAIQRVAEEGGQGSFEVVRE